MSGIDIGEHQFRKGALDAIAAFAAIGISRWR